MALIARVRRWWWLRQHEDFVRAAGRHGLTPHPDARVESGPDFRRRVYATIAR